jgi:hypothetical protein
VLREEVFFFEKKNQKTFVIWRALPERGWTKIAKVFCFIFSKKEALSFVRTRRDMRASAQ